MHGLVSKLYTNEHTVLFIWTTLSLDYSFCCGIVFTTFCNAFISVYSCMHFCPIFCIDDGRFKPVLKGLPQHILKVLNKVLDSIEANSCVKMLPELLFYDLNLMITDIGTWKKKLINFCIFG